MRDDTGKIEKGAHVRVIAPARSLGIVSGECRRIACERLAEMGLSVSFGRHAEETDEFCSSSAAARLEDLHEAFADRTVDGILTVIGGFNSVEILAGIDYRLIAENPKILCGFPILPRWQTQFMPRPVWSPIRDRIFPLSAC